MKPYFVFAGIMAAILGSAQAGGLYRWVDKAGNVHYGNIPAEGAAQVEEVRVSGSPATDDADMPYETRRAKESFPVTLYVADNCGEPCQKARDLLNKRGIPFTEKNLESQEDIDTFKQISVGEIIPALAVGKNWLNGFLAEQWNSELDIAGYPETTLYRPQLLSKPLAGKHAIENFPVTLYVAGNCSDPCQDARDFLNKRGIPFTEKNLTSNEEIDDFKKMSGGDDIPTLTFGNNWLRRFSTEQWSRELDIAGYPNTPPQHSQAPVTPLADKPAAENKLLR